MHCGGLLFLSGFVATKASCADWEAFQDYGSTSSDITIADSSIFSDFETLQGTSNVANLEEPFNPFESGKLETASSQLELPDLLAGVDDACSLPPARRKRARADDGSCSDSSNPSLTVPSFKSGLFGDNVDVLQLPHNGRKITTYEDANQRMTGQAFCPSQKIASPGLIIPVCNSEISQNTQGIWGSDFYTLLDSFMSTFSLHCLFGPPEDFPLCQLCRTNLLEEKLTA